MCMGAHLAHNLQHPLSLHKILLFGYSNTHVHDISMRKRLCSFVQFLPKTDALLEFFP